MGDALSLKTAIGIFILAKIRSRKDKMCCALLYILGIGYIIQKVLQRHKFIISVAEWKVLHLFQVKLNWTQLVLKTENVKMQCLTFPKLFPHLSPCFLSTTLKSKPCAGLDLTSQVVFWALKMSPFGEYCESCPAPATGAFPWTPAGLQLVHGQAQETGRRGGVPPSPLGTTQQCHPLQLQHSCVSPSDSPEQRATSSSLPASLSAGWARGPRLGFCCSRGWRLQQPPALGRSHRSGPAAAVNSHSTI